MEAGQVKSELENIRSTSSELLSVFEMRVRLFLNRYRILNSVNFKFAQMNDSIYGQLHNIMKQEKGLVRKFLSDDDKMKHSLARFNKDFTQVANNIEGLKESTLIGFQDGSKADHKLGMFVHPPTFKKYVSKMQDTFAHLEKDFRVAEERLEMEDIFLSKKDSANFKLFIKSFKNEQKTFDKAVHKVYTAVEKGKKVIQLTKEALTGTNDPRAGAAMTAGFMLGEAINNSLSGIYNVGILEESEARRYISLMNHALYSKDEELREMHNK